ncbi:MAG: Holliday junction resolvase Hjc [Desulfurococcaceae archaeon]
MPSNRARGFSHERDLVRKIWDQGLAVIRAPASGSKAKKTMYPDIVAIYKGKVVVIEAKTIKRAKTIYLEPYQVEKLLEFAKRASGESYIAVKVVGTGEWIFVSASKVERTHGGKYRLPKELLREGIKFDAFMSIIKGVRKLSEYTDT